MMTMDIMEIPNLSVANTVENNYVKWCGDIYAYTSLWYMLMRLIGVKREWRAQQTHSSSSYKFSRGCLCYDEL